MHVTARMAARKTVAPHLYMQLGLQATWRYDGACRVVGRVWGVQNASAVPQRAALVLNLQQQVIPCSTKFNQ